MSSHDSDARISVVVPAYNAARWIAETLETVRIQSRPPDEVIVVDDGSTDETAAIAASYGARVVRRRNAGLPSARNAGIAQARCDWIALLDADDLWSAEKLAAQRNAVAKTSADWCFTDYSAFDAAGVTCRSVHHDIHGHSQTATRTAYGDGIYLYDAVSLACAQTFDPFILPSSCLVRKELFVATGGFRDLELTEDVDWFLRALKRAAPAYVDRTLVAYRRHPEAITHEANRVLLDTYYAHLDLMLDAPHEFVPEAVAVARDALPRRARRQATLYLRQADPVGASRALRRLHHRRDLGTRASIAALQLLALPPLRAGLRWARTVAMKGRALLRRRRGVPGAAATR